MHVVRVVPIPVVENASDTVENVCASVQGLCTALISHNLTQEQGKKNFMWSVGERNTILPRHQIRCVVIVDS